MSLRDEGWISTRLFKAEEWIASLIGERQDENSGKVKVWIRKVQLFLSISQTLQIFLGWWTFLKKHVRKVTNEQKKFS